jgi:hypothetical protein
MNNIENTMRLVLEKYIIYLNEEYNHLKYLYEMKEDDNEMKDFDYEYVANSINYLTTNDEFNRNLIELNKLFTEHYDEQTGKQLIYENYKEHLEAEDYDDDDIQGLLDELIYGIDDLYDYFVGNVFFKNEEFIRETIDNLTNPILK